MKKMRQVRLAALVLTIAVGLAGCRGNNQQQSEQNAAPNSQAQDPAQINQAPTGEQTASSEPESSNYPSDNYYPEYSSSEAAEQAPDPPPPLPEYNQPECPGPDYLWTPGYWAWGSGGYYWVPGYWVTAPYVGALWTPGYWGFIGSVYLWHPGYWGPHIGYYGGINYGFGYVGDGFQGGYWSKNGFYYDRAVTNVDTTNITNVYNWTVVDNVNTTNVSYNGGPDGVRYRPSPAEIAASREHHIAALPAQVQVARSAAANRAQLASVNHGHPQLAAEASPVAVRRITPPAAAANSGIHAAARAGGAAGTPAGARPATRSTATRPPERVPARPATRSTATRPAKRAPAKPAAHRPAPTKKKPQSPPDERKPPPHS